MQILTAGFFRAVTLLLACLVLGGCASRSAHRPGDPGVRAVIYDEQSDGEQQLARAMPQARQQRKRLLLNLGANWCRDSQAMFRLLRHDARIAAALRRYYVLIMVDVNRRGVLPRNEKLVARLGVSLDQGIPVLLVLDSGGTLLNRDPSERLADSDHEDPDKVRAYLIKWANIPAFGR